MKNFVSVSKRDQTDKTSTKAQKVYGLVSFDTEDQETIYVKVALSPVSIENAKLNLQAELPGWDFEKTIAKGGELEFVMGKEPGRI